MPFFHWPMKILFDKLCAADRLGGKEDLNALALYWISCYFVQEGPVISFNAATTLRNFCLWQQTQNVLDDSHPYHHDTAVLITRYSFRNDPSSCNFLLFLFLSYTMTDTLSVNTKLLHANIYWMKEFIFHTVIWFRSFGS